MSLFCWKEFNSFIHLIKLIKSDSVYAMYINAIHQRILKQMYHGFYRTTDF